ncbi:hypothetical protein GOV05_02200 [Candidatus Woesearchaeota archaeon]|nr:hypothetical protein [Candidatus Woesearchaeota archaeon]
MARIINELSFEDLRLIKKDLEEGNIERLINKKITHFRKGDEGGVCPICHAVVDEENDLVFEFGHGIRKKAVFDAIDCLEYFLYKLKSQKQNSKKEELE